jgi:hypothetical protein
MSFFENRIKANIRLLYLLRSHEQVTKRIFLPYKLLVLHLVKLGIKTAF